jgi:hypothetical protein
VPSSTLVGAEEALRLAAALQAVSEHDRENAEQ